MEILDSFMNNYIEEFYHFFEDYRFSKLQKNEEYRGVLRQKNEIYEKYPNLMEVIEGEKEKCITKEESKALLEIIRLDSIRVDLEIKEAFKLGAKEFIVFAIEEDLIKLK